MRRSTLCLILAVAGRSAAAEPVVTYNDQIRPLFREHCLKCHGEDEQKADLNLSTFAGVMKGGSGGVAVVAGRASAGLLFEAITAEEDGERMPPKKPPLPKEQIELVRAWIQGGLRESSGSESMVAARDIGFKPAVQDLADGPPPMPRDLPKVTVPSSRRPLPVIALAASPRAPLLAVAGQEQVRLVDSASRDTVGILPFPEGQPNVIRFSRDGHVLMVAGGKPVQSGSVVLYDVTSGKRLAQIGDETDAVLAADLSPDQKLVALGGSGKTVKVFDTATGRQIYKLTKHTDWVTAVAFSPDGEKLATSDRAGGLHLWDARGGGILLTLAEHKASVRALSWRSDSRMLASGGEDGLIVWWDAKDGWPAVTMPNAHPPDRPPGQYGKLANGVLALTFGPKGELLSAGRDGRFTLWSDAGRKLSTHQSEGGLPLQVAVSLDGKTLVSGDEAGRLQFESAVP
ncbi:MAG: hypothetical protein KDN04_17340 [Verrucomicrobiae bacterium]|nr:hypothetical protein [Verrucomicrobiae bacterium]